MSDMPKTTFFLTALSLLGLYLWRVHRTPHDGTTGGSSGSVNAGSGLDPGTGLTLGIQTASGFGSQRVGDLNALRF